MNVDTLLYADRTNAFKAIEPGTRFGRLVVKRFVEDPRNGAHWLCVCDCGNERVAAGGQLRAGNATSCGCAHAGAQVRSSRSWNTWRAMKSRCRNPNDTHYEYYGGRGIGVCERWLNFLNFLADMGERPEGLTLDRIDNDRDYEPGNCRWATWSEQRINQRRMGKNAN